MPPPVVTSTLPGPSSPPTRLTVMVAKSAPDGYTLGMATIGHFSINQYLYSRMPWDIDRDFVPVALTYELPNVVIVSSQHCPARTLAPEAK